MEFSWISFYPYRLYWNVWLIVLYVGFFFFFSIFARCLLFFVCEITTCFPFLSLSLFYRFSWIGLSAFANCITIFWSIHGIHTSCKHFSWYCGHGKPITECNPWGKRIIYSHLRFSPSFFCNSNLLHPIWQLYGVLPFLLCF